MDLLINKLAETHKRDEYNDNGTGKTEALLPRQQGLLLVDFPLEDYWDDEPEDWVNRRTCQGNRIADLVYHDRQEEAHGN